MLTKEKAIESIERRNCNIDTLKTNTENEGLSKDIESAINSDSLSAENYTEILAAIRKVDGEAIRKQLCRELAEKLKLNEYDVILEAENGKGKEKRKAITIDLAIDADELINTPLPAQQYIIDPLLPAGHLLLLQGRRGHKKSIVALDLAIAIAQGRRYFGWTTTKSPVLYFDLENPTGIIQKRLALMGGAGSGLKLMLRKGIISLDIEKHMTELIAVVKGRVCVFDTLSKTHLRDENSPTSMTCVMKKFIELAQDHATGTVLLHHKGKNEELGGRGASSIEDNADVVIELLNNADTTLSFKCTKHRGADERVLCKTLNVNFTHDRIEISDVSAEEMQRFYTALKELSCENLESQTAIKDAMMARGFAEKKIFNMLKDLQKAGLIRAEQAGSSRAIAYHFC